MDEILGVNILGPHATDLIGEAVLAMRLEGTAQDIAQAIHPHPTLTEALKEAALDVDGRPCIFLRPGKRDRRYADCRFKIPDLNLPF